MRRFALLCVAVLPTLPPSASAQVEPAALERNVKAAFLYKFAGYADWPDSAFTSVDEAVTIGVIGDDAMAAELAQVVAGRTADDRPLSVRRLKEGDMPVNLHVLFVGSAERARIAPLAKALHTRPVLIVTETEGALNQGSVVNFVVSNGRVRFEIALDNAEKRNLKLSSRLLSVALTVRAGALP